MDEKFYTVEDISEMLKMHPKTIQRYIREGKLRATKIGKSWRVSGHDLSQFAESVGAEAKSEPEGEKITASAVADVRARTKDEAIRIMNGLTGALNAKPPEFGRSNMHAQYIEDDGIVRVTLWGGARFMEAIFASIAVFTEGEE